MNIIQNKTTKNITISFTAPDYNLFIPVLVVQKLVGEEYVYNQGYILNTNTHVVTLDSDGVYKIKVLYINTGGVEGGYYINGLNTNQIIKIENELLVYKTIEDIQNLTEGDIQSSIEEDYIVSYTDLYNLYIDSTQLILTEYLQDKDTYKNKQIQQILDMGLTIIDYLFTQQLYVEASRIIDKLIPYTINIE